MKLAYTICEKPGQTDRTLAALAETLISRGMAVAGVVQTNSKQCDQHLCDMDVRVLPDGTVYRISQSLGKEARGCRLDPGALEQAVGAVSATLGCAPELLIINKFGKHEADGRGFRPLIADALARDISVVLGVSKLSLARLFGLRWRGCRISRAGRRSAAKLGRGGTRSVAESLCLDRRCRLGVWG